MPTLHRTRKSLRLPDYDYSQPGSYFVTILVHSRECILCQILDHQIALYDAGRIVEKTWKELPNHYPGIRLEAFVVMPNHFHGVITLEDTIKPLSEIVRGFKSFSSRRINIIRDSQGQPVWHRSYYEHIIRSEEELLRVRDYINSNPLRWDLDEENLQKG